MFHPPTSNPFQTLSSYAEEDLRSFLLERVPEREWRRVLRQVRALDTDFPECSNVVHLLEELLPWLDKRKHDKARPWRTGESGWMELDDSSDILPFLDGFRRRVLDRMCAPQPRATRARGKLRDIVDSSCVDPLVKEYGQFLGKSRVGYEQWQIEFKPIAPGHAPNIQNFVSWLVVDPAKNGDANMLYILYDREAILEGIRDTHHFARRLTEVYLHELGHAIAQLDRWYLQKLRSGKEADKKWLLGQPDGMDTYWVESPARHESEAWTYAFAVSSCVKCARSWITRLVHEVDGEWH